MAVVRRPVLEDEHREKAWLSYGRHPIMPGSDVVVDGLRSLDLERDQARKVRRSGPVVLADDHQVSIDVEREEGLAGVGVTLEFRDAEPFRGRSGPDQREIGPCVLLAVADRTGEV